MSSGEDVFVDRRDVSPAAGIDWDAYASQYDLMAKYNPSYHENIAILRDLVDREQLPDDATICDLGAGTGNYITALARTRPEAHYYHVDFDRAMNDLALEKYRAQGLRNVSLIEQYVQDLEFCESTMDLVICVNALYAIAPQKSVLAKARDWLKPNGIFFVIDFGRRNKVADWGLYLISNLLRNHGVGECARFVLKSAELIRQNNRGSKQQAQGSYWLHSTEEFGEVLESVGFRVEELRSCYRGYCDLAICKR